MRIQSRSAAVLAAIAGVALVVGLVIGLTPRRSGPELAAPGANHATVSAAESANGPVAMGNGVFMGADQKHDTSAPLRDLKPYPVRALEAQDEADGESDAGAGAHPHAVDTVVQSSPASPAMPAAGLNFDGIPYPGVNCNCAPPDTNGEVGATQYVQIVNEGFQVFSKTTGASVMGPVGITTIWSGFGGVCETSGFGDPVVLYDQFAQRWLVSQFAGSSIPTHECVAVSTSSDATGSWNRYDFSLGTNFMDYPHGAVWTDGYYFSFNVFNSSGTSFLGAQPVVFDRTRMLQGQSATFQTISPLGSSSDAMLPADIDGSALPPSGAPESFVAFPSGFKYTTFHYHVDWVNVANTTWTTFAAPTAAGFTQLCPTTRNCVPQSGTSTGLDAIADRPMFRLAYRNFGDHEALVGNFTVSSGGVAGIRWFELRGVSFGPESLFQESTYQPDTTWRWMGSAAMDKAGDLALGFSASSGSMFPAIRYAGRLATDPAGTLAQGEATLFAGTGSQTATSNRWGDYSDLTIDPVDDCTFWFTSEYYSTTTSFNWRTRIGTFSFSGCAGPATTGSISGTVTDTNTNAGIANATVTLSGGGTGTTTTDASGNYSFSNLTTGGYTVTASKATYATGTGSSASVNVNAGSTSTANLTLTSTVGAIVGQVTSTSGGGAISGATVTLDSGPTTTTTDASGNYSFSSVAPGGHTVTPSKSGFQAASPTSVTVSAGVTTTQNLTLTPIPVTTTAFVFPGSAPTAVTSGAGDNDGYQIAPASWWTGFDGNLASDPNSGTASSQTCGSASRDQELFTGYSFGSSLGSSIVGLQVQLRGRVSSTGNSPKFCVQVWNGASWSTGKVTSTLKTSLNTYTLGATSDLWGLGWSPSVFTGGTFRLRITDLANSTSRTFYLDGVSVAVTYQ